MPDDIQTTPLLVEIAIEPKSSYDQARLDMTLARLVAEDGSFRVSSDRESGQTILKGLSEDHLAGKVGILTRDGIGFRIGGLQVAFLEHPTRRAEADYTHDRPTGPMRQFASVKLAVEPSEPGTGCQFASEVTEDTVPNEYIAGIQKGIESVLASGVIAGFPVADVRVALIGGRHHHINSSPLAFEIASRAACREALQAANPMLLEPIMKVEITTPETFAKAVRDDLRLRRAQIAQEDVGAAVTINAEVPLITMFGYGGILQAMSNGHATFSMRFDRYAPAAFQPENDPPFQPAVGMRA